MASGRTASKVQPAVNNQPRVDAFVEIYSDGASLEALRISHQYRTLWTYGVNVVLATWIITSPFLMDYRSSALQISDTTCGAVILLCELLSFSPKRYWFRLGTLSAAFWLLLAPLLFWSPTPAVYLQDTLVGTLTITFALLIPGLPGQAGIEMDGRDIPPGWSYNPSSWIRRWLGIALALAGFLISRYLAAHQLGYTNTVWDPFFGNGTERVLTSDISRSFPISDAGFGAVAYVMEVMAGCMGGRARWRTAPWTVAFFALLVLPLGITSIILVITQPMFVGAWCGLCLVAAAFLLTSVPLAVHEAVAVGQFLVLAHKQGKSVWEVFWHGGSTGVSADEGKDPDRLQYSLTQRWIASVQGVNIPVTLAAQIAIGAWLMARPDLLPATQSAANCDHLLGAFIVTTAALATAEVTRIARFANVLFGSATVFAGIFYAGGNPVVSANAVICGTLVTLLSIPRGPISEDYGNWNRLVR